MSYKSKATRICALIAGVSLLLGSATANAASLPCVQRAYDWKSGNIHSLGIAVTALNDGAALNVASYAEYGWISNNALNQGTFGSINPTTGLPIITNILSSSVTNGLSLFQQYGIPTLPPGSQGPLFTTGPYGFTINRLPTDDRVSALLTDYNGATYTFTPRCAGDMVVGDDGYGNHWIFAFFLKTNPV